MDLRCKLVKKAFTTKEGNQQDYYVLEFDLCDGTTLDVPIKSVNVKVLLMSANLSKLNK